MRSYNMSNTFQTTKKTDTIAPPKKAIMNGAIPNPQTNQNHFKPMNKVAFGTSTTRIKQQITVPKKQNNKSIGIKRFQITASHVQQKSNPFIQKAFISQAAPSSQFKRYLCDTDNVFYEDSSEMKKLRRIKAAKIYLTIFILILTIFYIGIGRIIAYPRQKCPRHAVCNVFIHCHKGYARINDTCIIDPHIVNKAKQISQAVVSQLSYNYGEGECLVEQESLPISTKIQDILHEFSVEDEMLRDEIIYFFMNKQNQNNYHFSYSINTITAKSKLYSLTCSTTLFIKSFSFKYYLLTFIFMILGGIKLFRLYSQYKKTKKIYQFLKRKTLGQNQMCINEAKKEIQALYGSWTAQIWMKVDRMRSQDGCIAYYTQNEQVFWKRID